MNSEKCKFLDNELKKQNEKIKEINVDAKMVLEEKERLKTDRDSLKNILEKYNGS